MPVRRYVRTFWTCSLFVRGTPPLWYWTRYTFTASGSDVRLGKIQTAIFALVNLAVLWFYTNVRPAEKS
jgi:hypothetical protein